MKPHSATSRELWFLDTRVVIRVSCDDGADRKFSVLEHQAAYGDSPPLHVHHNEDEIFHVIQGELQFRLGDRDLHATAGDTVLAPKGVPHTYRAVSAEGARWLTITRGEQFERFVSVLGRQATQRACRKHLGRRRPNRPLPFRPPPNFMGSRWSARRCRDGLARPFRPEDRARTGVACGGRKNRLKGRQSDRRSTLPILPETYVSIRR